MMQFLSGYGLQHNLSGYLVKISYKPLSLFELLFFSKYEFNIFMTHSYKLRAILFHIYNYLGFQSEDGMALVYR